MERIRFEELSRFDTEFEHAWRLATDVLHSPELQGQLRMTQACRYLVCGDLERGTGLIEPGNQSLQDLGTTWREPDRFILDSCQMLLTGTLAGHAEQMAARLAQPDHPSIPHLAAPPPRSWTWIQPIAYWAQVATALEVPDPARLHDQFAPHAANWPSSAWPATAAEPSTACWPARLAPRPPR